MDDDTAKVEPLKPRATKEVKVVEPAKAEEAFEDDSKRDSGDIFENPEGPSRSRNGTVRNTDSFLRTKRSRPRRSRLRLICFVTTAARDLRLRRVSRSSRGRAWTRLTRNCNRTRRKTRRRRTRRRRRRRRARSGVSSRVRTRRNLPMTTTSLLASDRWILLRNPKTAKRRNSRSRCHREEMVRSGTPPASSISNNRGWNLRLQGSQEPSRRRNLPPGNYPSSFRQKDGPTMSRMSPLPLCVSLRTTRQTQTSQLNSNASSRPRRPVRDRKKSRRCPRSFPRGLAVAISLRRSPRPSLEWNWTTLTLPLARRWSPLPPSHRCSS